MIMATYTAIEVRLLLFCGKHVESKNQPTQHVGPTPPFKWRGYILYTAIEGAI